ncbi:hypothetical protein BT96DRAFT_951392 [Gymnopus androsaceus JB14]|uniref:Uncharacterized protein n=1 Tax=Gymnopus androsaceus JB14 TaxID=1447944 RepID=A0A6A4GDA5_9AGAR|nr:hypothetical protein BT96DRAFT_951392 [Gymnopus androsaceus JB14]
MNMDSEVKGGDEFLSPTVSTAYSQFITQDVDFIVKNVGGAGSADDAGRVGGMGNHAWAGRVIDEGWHVRDNDEGRGGGAVDEGRGGGAIDEGEGTIFSWMSDQTVPMGPMDKICGIDLYSMVLTPRLGLFIHIWKFVEKA